MKLQLHLRRADSCGPAAPEEASVDSLFNSPFHPKCAYMRSDLH